MDDELLRTHVGDLVRDLERELRDAPYKGQLDYVRGYGDGLMYALRTVQSIFPKA